MLVGVKLPCQLRLLQPRAQALHQDARRNADVEALCESVHRDFDKGIGVRHHEVRRT